MNQCRHAATVVRAAAMLLIVTAYAGAAGAAVAPTPHRAPLAKGAVPAPNAALIQRAWWNQPELVDALKLTDAQRMKMNDLLTHSVESQRAAQPQQQQHQKAFEQALANGDWASARKEATALRDGLATTWAAQTALKIDVLSALTAEQRQIVAAHYPLLLRQPSVFGLPKGPPLRPAVATPHS
jgi:Spy/CpxP family protein refolding chaperone